MIREATEADIPQLLEWGRIFADMARLDDHIGFDEDSVRQTLETMIAAPEHVVFISERGMIGGITAPHPFNYGRIVCEELFWWSEGGDGLRLLAALEQWARARCFALGMKTLDAVQPEATGRLYSKMGFEPLERGFLKVL